MKKTDYILQSHINNEMKEELQQMNQEKPKSVNLIFNFIDFSSRVKIHEFSFKIKGVVYKNKNNAILIT